MALRCLLFSSDEGTAEPIRQVLAGLGVEGEYCSEAVVAVDKVTNQNFQIVIIDWDKQPEAGQLLTAARERKASERPLTLAIVSDDGSVPKAFAQTAFDQSSQRYFDHGAGSVAREAGIGASRRGRGVCGLVTNAARSRSTRRGNTDAAGGVTGIDPIGSNRPVRHKVACA
jgi:hypothetical protein